MKRLLTCALCLDHVSHVFCTYLLPEDVEKITSCLSSEEMTDAANRGMPAKLGGARAGVPSQISSSRGKRGRVTTRTLTAHR